MYIIPDLFDRVVLCKRIDFLQLYIDIKTEQAFYLVAICKDVF